MKLTCTAKNGNKLTFVYEHDGVTRTVELTEQQYKNLSHSNDVERMIELPEGINVGILNSVIAFGIYTLSMLKPINQELVGTFIQLGKPE